MLLSEKLAEESACEDAIYISLFVNSGGVESGDYILKRND